MLSLRRPCCVWQCSKDLQPHNAFWVTPCRRRILFFLCIARLLDGQGRFQHGLSLALRFLCHRRFTYLVQYRSDISQVLQRDESTGHRQAKEAPVRAQSTAIRGMVVCLWDCACPLRTWLSFSRVAPGVTDAQLRPFTFDTGIMNRSSSALGTCSSKVTGLPTCS